MVEHEEDKITREAGGQEESLPTAADGQAPAPEAVEPSSADAGLTPPGKAPEPDSNGASEATPAEAAPAEAAPAEAAETDAPDASGTAAPSSAGAAAETEGGETPPAASKMKWYVIHTYSGHENKVKANLERAIQYAKVQDKFGEIVVATEDYAVMKAGKKHITKRKTFPSYVLVEMEMSDDIRALVQNIPGVTHFVGDRRPTPLTDAEVRRIRGEEVRETGKVTAEVPFKVGETVKVTEGPFADFVGTVDEINLERGKLRVMVSIFGRPTAVELDLMHVTNI